MKARSWLWLIGGWLLVACTGEPVVAPTPIGQSSVAPTDATQADAQQTPQSTPPTPAFDEFVLLAAGLERRTLEVRIGGLTAETIFVLRIDPALYRFDIGYAPEAPQTLESWRLATGAIAAQNGGFFTETFHATGLIAVDGVVSGSSYVDFGGMLNVDDSGVRVRSLVTQPYQPNEPLDDALQSFPMLMEGGVASYNEVGGQRARRSAIGIDEQGRVLLLTTLANTFTLTDFSQFLATAELDLVSVLNLDGGSSAGLLVADCLAIECVSAEATGIVPLTPLPTVLLVHHR